MDDAFTLLDVDAWKELFKCLSILDAVNITQSTMQIQKLDGILPADNDNELKEIELLHDSLNIHPHTSDNQHLPLSSPIFNEWTNEIFAAPVASAGIELLYIVNPRTMADFGGFLLTQNTFFPLPTDHPPSTNPSQAAFS